jgi:isochorismate synthase
MACNELSGQQGFVMAPFAVSPSHPLLLIRADEVTSDLADLDGLSDLVDTHGLTALDKGVHADYHMNFANFHAQLCNHSFQKLVLSRSIELPRTGDETPLQLFQRACERYPRMMICLVYTPQSGLWLAATPEILLAWKDHRWQTIALAGTMKYEEELRWSDKNIQEQRYVATYITHQLEQFTHDFTEEGPRTARAGHLAHLRSDFLFSLPDESVVGDLLQALHPTPAVCGLPKQEAFRFIQQNEHHDRSYYSGFMGPLFLNGQTNIFVTLRCMQLFRDGYRLYAGGGLLKDSVEEQEWQETETKLDTIRRLFNNNVL